MNSNGTQSRVLDMRDVFFDAANIISGPEMLNGLTRGMLRQSVFDGVVDNNFADDVSKTSASLFQLLHYCSKLNPGLSAVGGSLMPAWVAWAGKVPRHIISTKFLAFQNFYTSNAVWDLPCPGGPRGIRLPPTLEADMPG